MTTFERPAAFENAPSSTGSSYKWLETAIGKQVCYIVA
jgi:hypothetical protein